MAVTDQLGLGSIDFGGIGSSIGSVLLWVIIFVFIGGIIWFILWVLSFKDTVIIKEPVGEGFEYKPTKDYTVIPQQNIFKKITATIKSAFIKEVKQETKTEEPKPTQEKIRILPFIGSIHRAKIIRKHGVYKLSLFSPAKTLKIPDNVFQAMTKKGRKFIELTKISEHIYAPTILSDKGKTQYIYDESYFSWVVNDIEDDQKKYAKQSFWDKYGTYIAFAATMVLCMIIIVVVLKQAQKLADSSTASMGAISKSFENAAAIISSQKI